MIVLKKRFSHRGVTLPELLLAAFILAFVISGILLLLTYCSILNDSSRNLTYAANHAQFIMEDIFSHFEDKGIEETRDKIDEGDWDWDQDMLQQKGLAVLFSENISTQMDEDSDLISVTVSWQDRNQRAREFILQTMWGAL